MPTKKTKAPPFQKGNKFGKGRPKGSLNLSTRLKKSLEAKLTLDKKDGSKETKFTCDWVIDSLLMRAIKKGDVAAIREIFDRVDGKASQSLDIGNKNGEAFKTEMYFDKSTIKTIAKVIVDEE